MNDAYVEDYYLIKLSEGKNVYLQAEGKGYKWSSRDNAIWFNTEEDAREFAEGYFKDYDTWKIESIKA